MKFSNKTAGILSLILIYSNMSLQPSKAESSPGQQTALKKWS